MKYFKMQKTPVFYVLKEPIDKPFRNSYTPPIAGRLDASGEGEECNCSKQTKEKNLIDTSNKLFELTVNMPLSNQNVGRSRHWSSAAKVKDKWVKALRTAEVLTDSGVHLDLHTFLADVLGGKPVAQKVGIVTTRVLGKGMRLFDMDSIGRGDCKEALDAIVKCGILTDDSPKHVAWWFGQQDDTQRSEGPFTVFTFYGAK